MGAAESERPLPSTISISPNLQDDDFNPAPPPQSVPLSIANFDQQADSVDDIAVFSSRGPTDDNRIKPEIVAPGAFILSCRSSVSTADVGPDGLAHGGTLATFYADDADGVATHAEAVGRGLPGAPFFGAWTPDTPAAPAGAGPLVQQNYFYNSSTSMATPVTSGCVALLRQYLRTRRGVATPSAALLEALLVNGASVPAGESNAPDNQRGFGWIDMNNTVRPSPTGRQGFSDDVDLAVATGEVRASLVQLADPGAPFRVTLVWNDAPGSGIQNELYLRVIDPDGTVFDGDLTPFPVASNNTQRMHIAAPVAGTYTVEVRGIDVLFGIAAHQPAQRQDFALAVINGVGFSPRPVAVLQVIDRSGSMDFYGYMEPAKGRAKTLVQALRVADRTGVAAFNHDAATVHAFEPIAGFATQDAIAADISGIMADGLTSMGAGLQHRVAGLLPGAAAGNPQAIVLLSDGHENTPPWIGGGATDSPPSWYTGPDHSETLPGVPAGTRVYTVSLGEQSDQVLLQDIAMLTGGQFYAIHSAAEIGRSARDLSRAAGIARRRGGDRVRLRRARRRDVHGRRARASRGHRRGRRAGHPGGGHRTAGQRQPHRSRPCRNERQIAPRARGSGRRHLRGRRRVHGDLARPVPPGVARAGRTLGQADPARQPAASQSRGQQPPLLPHPPTRAGLVADDRQAGQPAD